MPDENQTMPADQPMDGDYVPAVRYRSWALVEKGKVVDFKRDANDRHPFGEVKDGQAVIDPTGVPCAVGYVVDSRGNVAPPLPNGEVLEGHEPAYHDRAIPSRPTAAYVAAFATGEPHDLEKDGDNPIPLTHRDVHPQADLVQEGPVRGKIDPT